MKSIAFLNTQMQKKFEEEFKKVGFRPYEMGYAHGYVAVSPDHPLHGLGYDKVYDLIDVEVWGGLTFSEKKSECQWDEQCVEMIDGGSFSDIPDNWWIFGFDTMHYNDGPEHNREWCINETKRMQQQLDSVINNNQ